MTKQTALKQPMFCYAPLTNNTGVKNLEETVKRCAIKIYSVFYGLPVQGDERNTSGGAHRRVPIFLVGDLTLNKMRNFQP